MDTKSLLQSLNTHKVNYVVIGATAGIAHGFDRLTQDIDIFVEPTPENMKKTFQALEAAGYDLQEMTIEQALQKKLLFRGYILKTDIHPFVTGIDFETIWKNKI